MGTRHERGSHRDAISIPVPVLRFSRNKWPLERCWRPKFWAILSQTVPLPEPGGPRMTARRSLEAMALAVARTAARALCPAAPASTPSARGDSPATPESFPAAQSRRATPGSPCRSPHVGRVGAALRALLGDCRFPPQWPLPATGGAHLRPEQPGRHTPRWKGARPDLARIPLGGAASAGLAARDSLLLT